MEPRNEIAVELSALSELLSGIDRHTPYGVPDGYFDRFPPALLGRIAEGSPALQAPADSRTFQVPDGYFDGLAARVLSRVKTGAMAENLSENFSENLGDSLAENAREELAALSATVAAIGRETPYQLPEGYFGELSPVLTLVGKTRAYRVPEEYFEELSPIVSVAGEQSGYRVPDGYFETLPAAVLAKLGLAAEAVPGPGAAKVIPIGRGGDSRSDQKVLKGHWWKYSSVAAIAACFLLIFNWPQPAANPGPKKPDVAQGLQKVSDQELEAYLDDQHSFIGDAASASYSTATLDMNEGEVKSLLSGVTDNDLQQYIDEHGKEEDIATN